MTPQYQKNIRPSLFGLFFTLTLFVSSPHLIAKNNETKVRELSLKECLHLLQQQPIYKRARLEELGQNELIKNNLSAYRPSLQLDLFSGWRRPNHSFSNPTGSNEIIQAGATLSQFIYGFGLKKIAHSVVDVSERVTELQRKEFQSNLEWQLRQRFSQYLFLKEQAMTAQAAITLAKTEMDIANSSFKAGISSELVLRQAKQNWFKARSALIDHQNALDSSLDQLKVMLGHTVAPNGQLGLGGVESGKSEVIKLTSLEIEPSPERLNGSLSVQLLTELIRKHQQQSKGFKTSRLPNLHGILNAERFGDQWHDTQHDWRAGLQLNWTIDTQHSARRQASAESYQAQTFQEDLRQLKNERQSQHELIVKTAKSLEQQKTLQVESLKEAKELLNITTNLFKTGAIAYPRVEEARFNWVNAQLQLNKSLLDIDLNHHRYLRWLN